MANGCRGSQQIDYDDNVTSQVRFGDKLRQVMDSEIQGIWDFGLGNRGAMADVALTGAWWAG